MSKPSPFDHNGKPAYRALVFRCRTGGPFVGFLAKYSDQSKAQAEAAAATALAGTPSHLVGNPPMDRLKQPSESTWRTNSNPSQSGLPEVRCPDGKGIAVPVRPSDLEAGAMN